MNEIYGKSTYGKDGILYRSMFEANFADKFLYEQYTYEYEKPYNDGTKRTCDFYVKDLNLWIECAWGETSQKYVYQNSKLLYLDVPYKEKELAKHYGAMWDKDEKKWYIFPNGNRQKDFEQWMFQEDKEIIEISEQQITNDYASKLNQKIVDNIDKRVMTVSGKDIKTYSHLQRIISVNLKSYYDELLENRKLKQHQKKQYVKPNQTEYDYALEIYNTLEGKDKKRFNKHIQRQIQEQKSQKKHLRRNRRKALKNV